MSPSPPKSGGLWPRALIHVDMDAFFASVEQRDNPAWLGRPIGITNGAQGTCIITCSYEARARGIKTGMRVRDALRCCPEFIQVPARPERYARVSRAIMASLSRITPDVEVFSVDEAFLDVTGCQRLWGTPEAIAYKVRQTVYEVSRLTCSVGLSADKTTAKYAGKRNKPNGIGIIPPWSAAEALAEAPVTALCGIAGGIGRYLAERGVFTCGDMRRLPVGELARRFGNTGRRIWLMCQGLDPDDLHHEVPEPKSIGHGKVVPPDTRNSETVRVYLDHMAERVGERLRRHRFRAGRFFIGVKIDAGWLSERLHCDPPTDDGAVIKGLCHLFLERRWRGQGVHQVQVTALDPRLSEMQLELFGEEDELRRQLNLIRDRVNRAYGEFTLMPARMLEHSAMPNVIAPAWKSDGHRECILSQEGTRTPSV